MPVTFPLSNDAFSGGQLLVPTPELGLVVLLNDLDTRSNDLDTTATSLQAQIDAIEVDVDLNYLLDASEAQLANAISVLESEIAESAADVGAAAISAVDALAESVADDVAGLASTALLADAVAGLESQLAESAADTEAAAVDAVSVLAEQVADDIGGLVSAEQLADVEAALQDADAATSDAAAALLDAEVAEVNRRIGVLYEVDTPDATPVVIATITPTINSMVRITAKILAQRLLRSERAAYTVEVLARAIPSSDVLTLSVGVPSDGETVVLDAVTYTWRLDPTGIPFAVDVGGTIEASIDNLVAAINLSGTGDVEYGVGTTRHPTVAAEKGSATTMDAVARTPGVAGDAIAATETMTNGVWGGGGTLGSGSDMTVDVITDDDDFEDDASWDAGIAAGAGQDVEISVTGAADTVIRWSAEVKTITFV